MIEKVGKIRLDLSKYEGQDLYSDGSVEEDLLRIVKEESKDRYTEVIHEKKQWPILYHLSPLRENIVEWLPITSEDKVLEVGSGCGALTGCFARKAGEVTCVELSKRRSLINAYRNSDCGNVTIHVGNFKDIEPDLPGDYSYICLIGVFEYGQSYIGGQTPYEDFLKILLPHLKEGGRIVIAIENKYGLKYFAGCREDHLGSYFSGIESYADGGGARTFGRGGLERIFAACGVNEWHFYYPYPDYKFMTTLYSDEYLPRKGELSNNIRNFDRDRLLLFDEKRAFDGIVEEGLFPVFSNSYLVVLGGGLAAKFVKYSNDRANEYVIKTQIVREANGGVAVSKIPLSEQARAHVEGMETSYEKLLDRYQGGRLRINRCRLDEEGAHFDYVYGIPLSELMDECLARGDLESFYAYFREYVDRIDYGSDYPVADFDLVFSNILVSGEEWTLIDYEWTFGKSISTKELAYRAVYCYLLEDKKRKVLDEDRILKALGITPEEAEQYRKQEAEFQNFVTNGHRPMAKILGDIGKHVIMPLKWLATEQDLEFDVQIYEDRGEGYREENSYFIPEAYLDDNLIDITIKVENKVKAIRVDPCMGACLVKLRKVVWNGKDMELGDGQSLVTNGSFLKRAADESEGEVPGIFFPDMDPNISFPLESLERKEENVLRVQMEVAKLSPVMARELAASQTMPSLKEMIASRLRNH